MKLALSLCGGGSLGSYEVGAYELLLELGYDFDIFTGTSIGAINAAVFASEDFSKISQLWTQTTIDDVIKYGFNFGPEFLRSFDFKTNWPHLKAFMKSFLRHKGADISPLRKMLHTFVDPHKFKTLDKKVGIVTTAFPSLKEVDVILNDTKAEDIIDYLLASSSAFPLFPIYKFKKKRYIDGGYVNNLPLDLAFSLGADEAVAIALHSIPPNPQHIELLSLPIVRAIIPTRDTGSIMDFTPEVIAHNRRLGYLDAAKRMGVYYGYRFAFKKSEKWEALALKFRSYLAHEFLTEYKTAERVIAFAPYPILSAMDILVRPLEIAGDALKLDYLKLYDIKEFIDECLAKLSTDEYRQMGEQFAKKKNLALGLKDSKIPAFLSYSLLTRGELRRDPYIRKTSQVDPLAGVLLALSRFLYYQHLLS